MDENTDSNSNSYASADDMSKRDRQKMNAALKSAELKRASTVGATKTYFLWGFLFLGLLLLIGGPVYYSQATRIVYESPSVSSVSQRDNYYGKVSSDVVLVEYGDLQCPACRAALPMVQQLKKEYSDRIAIVFRHFPLRAIHPNALVAALAAEAAAAQGKFWEYHDLLYEKQPEWSALGRPYGSFVEYAELLDLDIVAFEQAYESKEVRAKVEADERSGTEFNLRSTPSFLLQGEKITVRSYEDLKALVDAELGE